jgi:3-dehydroquinate dehydratase / shikimate dehydrogenase
MGTLLFGVISGPDIKSAEPLLEQSKPYIDGIELRLDHFKKIDMAALKTFLKNCGLPVMFTLRRNDQGGAFSGTETDRLSLLESLCTLQPAYIDLEYDVPIAYRKKLFEGFPKISFLSSFHDFTYTPDDLDALYQKIKTPYTHIYKLAVTAKSSIDALRLLSFVQARTGTEKFIGISMGEEGRPTRILAPIVGCYLTYATLTVNGTTAPGQMTAREMQEIYRFRKLNRRTAIYAVIGDPVDKSLGPLIHNAVFDQTNINAVYLRIKVKKEELSAFFTLAEKLPFKGFSVTMPHKEAIMPFLTEVSAQARAIGACNTIDISKGKLTGYNTDGIGALDAIEKRGPIKGQHIVFIGAGGAAKAMIFEAAQRGALVTVINRTPAIEIAQAVKGRGGGWDLLSEVCKTGYDIIVNCTPKSEAIEERWILPEKIAMDIVYVPKNTPFLVKASHKKCRIVFGYEMFVGQAVEQQRIWSPKIDIDKTYAIINALLSS